MSRAEEFAGGQQERPAVKMPKGQAFVEHMEKSHGYVTWNTPKAGTREYKKWQRDHLEYSHGRWEDQADHVH